MKKTFKKLMAALLAVALLCAMAVPAFAASAKDQTHSFTAYQIFSGTNSTDKSDTALGNIQWGDGVNAEAFLTALKADETIGTDFTGIEFNDAACARKVAAVVAERYGDNSDKATIFAALHTPIKPPLLPPVPVLSASQMLATTCSLIPLLSMHQRPIPFLVWLC